MKSRIFLAISLILISLSTLSFAALDLKFTSQISLSPSAPKVGDTVTFTVSFKSSGAAVTNMKIIGGIDGVQTYQKTFASINKNGARSISFPWTATEGTHKAFFTLDPAQATGDSNYNNNNIEKQFNVSGSQNVQSFNIHSFKEIYKLKPDLIVSDVTGEPLEAPKCGKKWRMGIFIKNIGAVSVPKPFRVTVTIQGIQAVDKELGAGLQPGQEMAFYYDWYILNEAYVRIVADFYNAVDESNEENNAMFPKITCDK